LDDKGQPPDIPDACCTALPLCRERCQSLPAIANRAFRYCADGAEPR